MTNSDVFADATQAAGTGEPMIQLVGVDKFFGDFQALKNINLDVYKGGYYNNVVNVGKSEKVGKKRKMVYIRPTLKSTSAAGNLKKVKSTLDIDFSASSAKGAYPITITTWALCKPGMAKNGDVQKVLKYFYGSKAQGQLKNYLFSPLPAAVKKVALKRVALCK